MGCSTCGGGRRGSTIAQASASSDSLAAGQLYENPLLIGDANDVILRVRVAVAVEGLKINYQYWVTGTGVQAHIDSGAFIDTTGITQQSRLYRVGQFTYTSLQDANRVAAATGQEVIEVA